MCVDVLGVRCCRHNLHIVVSTPVNTLLAGRLGNGHGKECADTGADYVRVEDVGTRIADNKAIAPGSIRAAEHRAQVAGLLNGFSDYVETGGGSRQVVKIVVELRPKAEKSFRSIPVGNFAKDLRARLENPGPGGLCPLNEFRFVLTNEQLGTDVEFFDHMVVLQSPENPPVAFDKYLLAPVAMATIAELGKIFDPRVLCAG